MNELKPDYNNTLYFRCKASLELQHIIYNYNFFLNTALKGYNSIVKNIKK